MSEVEKIYVLIECGFLREETGKPHSAAFKMLMQPLSMSGGSAGPPFAIPSV